MSAPDALALVLAISAALVLSAYLAGMLAALAVSSFRFWVAFWSKS